MTKKRYLKDNAWILIMIAKVFENTRPNSAKAIRIERHIDQKVREVIYFSGI
jgi:hypothetical protein